ncbi:apolipoprotein N-acyltransferase [Campylobacter hyointestinalis subsp. lawsonii CCUG 27631]|uniref:apolipoprotein N-acyltransferase n=1 Tax=Campylobacter hyointestinalis TaxID=198 RepID=UPI0007C8D56C|nr:apolipoprotein N-acyltransferase [Campylobacter hyointestinalis]ANE34413.1 apolipoprotein N-acyltransferase [Campylobacter hyointestinalis subsp. lawsonii CCUG 27631]
MKLKYFLLAWVSFGKKNLRDYFTLNFIIKGFGVATLLSIFIFLSIFEISYFSLVGCFLAIFGLYLLLKSDKQIWFWSGFFSGILWFYWISFSLIYYGFWYLIPVEILGIGFIYAFIFLACGYFSNLIIRASLLVLLGYFYPFNFNWFNLELIFVDTIFKPQIWTLAAVLIGLVCMIKFKYGVAVLICALLININLDKKTPNLLPFKVELANTKIPQSIKWERNYKDELISQNLKIIDSAIDKNASLVVLPESAFALFLDHQKELLEYLKEKSKKISIVTGSLGYENGTSYNSTYLFLNGDVKRLDKVILVPFGEEIPLPKFATNFINKIFFNGNKDFGAAKEISDYEIGGVKIRNAICYEATRDEIYANNPKFVIAITNNGWFVPSTEPTLQEILLKYYAYKYNTTIYHSVNGSHSKIITP